MQPEQQLPVVIGREDGMVLVVQREVFAVRCHLDDLLPDLDAERLKTKTVFFNIGDQYYQTFFAVNEQP